MNWRGRGNEGLGKVDLNEGFEGSRSTRRKKLAWVRVTTEILFSGRPPQGEQTKTDFGVTGSRTSKRDQIKQDAKATARRVNNADVPRVGDGCSYLGAPVPR